MTVIRSKQYWEEITSKISEKLKKNKIVLLDRYVFESGKRDKLLEDISDIDSIMILKRNYSDTELISIRKFIDIFDKSVFLDIANYDGYRFF